MSDASADPGPRAAAGSTTAPPVAPVEAGEAAAGAPAPAAEVDASKVEESEAAPAVEAAAAAGLGAGAGGDHGASEEEKVEESREPLRTNWTTAVEAFGDMGLHENVLRGTSSYGLESPSEIQTCCIPALLKGRDVVVQSKRGSGKTAAYVIGALNRLDMESLECQVLVIVPRRELACAIGALFSGVGEFTKPVVHTVVGGRPAREDRTALRAGVHVVVGTPGRITDSVRRTWLSFSSLKLLVMDEADDMLERGFKEQLYGLLHDVPATCQLGLFGRSLPRECEDIVHKFMNDPAVILRPEDPEPMRGKHYYVDVEREDWKLDTLLDLYEVISESASAAQVVVFCNHRRKADWVDDRLRASALEVSVSVVHGDTAADERAEALRQFGAGAIRILVCTDIVTRERFANCPLVINYDTPTNLPWYLLRWQCTHPHSRWRVATPIISFSAAGDARYLSEVERRYSVSIEELPMDVALILGPLA